LNDVVGAFDPDCPVPTTAAATTTTTAAAVPATTTTVAATTTTQIDCESAEAVACQEHGAMCLQAGLCMVPGGTPCSAEAVTACSDVAKGLECLKFAACVPDVVKEVQDVLDDLDLGELTEAIEEIPQCITASNFSTGVFMDPPNESLEVVVYGRMHLELFSSEEEYCTLCGAESYRERGGGAGALHVSDMSQSVYTDYRQQHELCGCAPCEALSTFPVFSNTSPGPHCVWTSKVKQAELVESGEELCLPVTASATTTVATMAGVVAAFAALF